MTTTSTDKRSILTDEEIATLNAARTILDSISKRTPHTRSGGVVDCQADETSHALFMFLNRACSHLLAPLTYDQLHNGKRPKS
jgi:hypothetical protein